MSYRDCSSSRSPRPLQGWQGAAGSHCKEKLESVCVNYCQFLQNAHLSLPSHLSFLWCCVNLIQYMQITPTVLPPFSAKDWVSCFAYVYSTSKMTEQQWKNNRIIESWKRLLRSSKSNSQYYWKWPVEQDTHPGAVLLSLNARHWPLQKHLFSSKEYSPVLLTSAQMIKNELHFLFFMSFFSFPFSAYHKIIKQEKAFRIT